MALEALGDGPPVLILHGLFGSGRNWRSVARALSATHRVLAVDLRNHGSSTWADSMSYLDMAEDVRRLIRRQGLTQPLLVGHSIGDKVAMAVALMWPEAVERLIVVDAAPVSYQDMLSGVAEAMHAADVEHATSRELVRGRLSARLHDPVMVAFLMANLVARAHHHAWRLNLPAIQAAIPMLTGSPRELLNLRCTRPVQVLAGAASDYVTESDGVQFRPMFPSAQVEFIPCAGRWVHADQPTEFLRALQADMVATLD